jgi:hypothetical protein
LSTTEAEFIAATEASKELLWLKKFVCQLGFHQGKYVLFCDNQSAIHLSKNSSFHARSKHIYVRYHWIRDVLNSKQMQLEKVHTSSRTNLVLGFLHTLCPGQNFHPLLLFARKQRLFQKSSPNNKRFLMAPPARTGQKHRQFRSSSRMNFCAGIFNLLAANSGACPQHRT